MTQSSFILRPWQLSDAEHLAANANNPEIAKFLTDAFPHPYSEADAKAFIAMATKDAPIHIFAIEVDGKAVGGIGIHPQTDIMRKNAELGYWLGQPYWGRGIITGAILQMLNFAFSTYDIVRVFARPYGTNTASQRVLEKAGFGLEAKIEKNIFKNGHLLDECIYGFRKEQWLQSPENQ